MLRTRSLLTVPVLTLTLTFASVAQLAEAAEAAAKRTTVSVKASPKTVALQSPATVQGKVSGRSAGVKVTLQRRSATSWKAVKSTRVKSNKTYRFKVTIRDARTAFRVKVAKNKRIRSATSKTVTVTGSTANDATRTLILDETNAFRAKNGLPPLALMPELNAIAQDWSNHMAATSDFDHRPNFTSRYPQGWSGAAENIAAGQSPETVVDAWIGSAGHRANLLGDFNYIGIGYASGGDYGRYYTQNFAKYR